MENLNRVLLENVLPAHVAEHFLGRNWKNEVNSQCYSFTVLSCGTYLSCLTDIYMLKEQFWETFWEICL